MAGEYLFIDGGYFQRVWDDLNKQWFNGTAEIMYPHLGGAFKKVFYYDALPAAKDGESAEEFSAREKAKHEFFNSLRSLDGWHVYEGISKRAKGERPRQKEVDVLIAVDMLTHTHRKNTSGLAFIAGDQDFRPLVDAVVREGMYVSLWYAKGSIAEDLKNTADASFEMNVVSMYQFLDRKTREAFPMPQRSGRSEEYDPPDTYLAEVGMRDGETVAKVWRGTSSSYITSTKLENSRLLTHWNCFAVYRVEGNLEFAKKHYDHEYGKVEWQPYT